MFYVCLCRDSNIPSDCIVLLDCCDIDFLRNASLILLSLLLYLEFISTCSTRRQYSRSELLQLHFVRPAGVSDITLQILNLIQRNPENIYEEPRPEEGAVQSTPSALNQHGERPLGSDERGDKQNSGWRGTPVH